MSTPLKDLFRFIRYEIVRKDDVAVLPDLDLELAMEYVVSMDFDSSHSVVEVLGVKGIEPTLTEELRKKLILKTALSILIPEDSFSYRTASLSKFIEGIPGLEEHRQNLRERLEELESGGIGRPVLSSNEIDKFVNEGTRLSDTLTTAQSET